MTRSAMVFRGIIFALVLMPVTGVIMVWVGRDRIVEKRSGLPVLGSIGEFSLVESSGKPTGSAELRGQVWIAGFILTRCSGTCPIITHSMKLVQADLPERADLKLVSISVDPVHDTPAVLADYAQKNGADRSRWWFLTGPRAEVYRVTREAFRLVMDDSSGTPEEPVTHSSKLVLVDRRGQIRGYYDGTDVATLKQVVKDARLLVALRS